MLMLFSRNCAVTNCSFFFPRPNVRSLISESFVSRVVVAVFVVVIHRAYLLQIIFLKTLSSKAHKSYEWPIENAQLVQFPTFICNFETPTQKKYKKKKQQKATKNKQKRTI